MSLGGFLLPLATPMPSPPVVPIPPMTSLLLEPTPESPRPPGAKPPGSIESNGPGGSHPSVQVSCSAVGGAGGCVVEALAEGAVDVTIGADVAFDDAPLAEGEGLFPGVATGAASFAAQPEIRITTSDRETVIAPKIPSPGAVVVSRARPASEVPRLKTGDLVDRVVRPSATSGRQMGQLGDESSKRQMPLARA